MKKIPWKRYPIEAVAEDGTRLKGVIHYWEKDYSVELTEPLKGTRYGGHLMYHLPLYNVVDPSRETTIEQVGEFRYEYNIYHNAIAILKELYIQEKERKERGFFHRFVGLLKKFYKGQK